MRKNQQGVSYIGVLIAIIGFAFLVKIVIAVWAPYWDDRVIDGQITELIKISPRNIYRLSLQTRWGNVLT